MNRPTPVRVSGIYTDRDTLHDDTTDDEEADGSDTSLGTSESELNVLDDYTTDDSSDDYISDDGVE